MARARDTAHYLGEGFEKSMQNPDAWSASGLDHPVKWAPDVGDAMLGDVMPPMEAHTTMQRRNAYDHPSKWAPDVGDAMVGDVMPARSAAGGEAGTWMPAGSLYSAEHRAKLRNAYNPVVNAVLEMNHPDVSGGPDVRDVPGGHRLQRRNAVREGRDVIGKKPDAGGNSNSRGAIGREVPDIRVLPGGTRLQRRNAGPVPSFAEPSIGISDRSDAFRAGLIRPGGGR